MKILPRLSQRQRKWLAAAAGCISAVGLALIGVLHVLPPVHPQMLAGSIWLASRAVGELTLVDGVSARVSAKVGVARPDTKFQVSRLGHNGYAIDERGHVVGVNGTTMTKFSTKPLPNASGGLTVHATTSALFAVDSQHRLVQAVAPDDLAPMGSAFQLDAQPNMVASDGNLLWAAGRDGNLISFDATADPPARRQLRGVNTTKASVTATDGGPVVVDLTSRTAHLISLRSGEIKKSLSLPMHSDDDVVIGSPNTARVIVLQKHRGLLVVCAFTLAGCGPGIPLGDVGAELGAAVEAGDHVFVPDYTAGVVQIVNLSDTSTLHTEVILPDARFELLGRDGIVFFNDPDSEHAGVIAPDGQVRRIKKYDPRQAPTETLTSTSATNSTGPSTPSPRPSTARTSTPPSNGSDIPTSSDGSGTPVPSTSSGTPDQLRIVRIISAPSTPETGQRTTISAEVVGGSPGSWSWRVTRPDGQTEATGTAAQLVHTFPAAGTYSISLAVAEGDRRDEQSTQLTVVVPSPPVNCGDTLMVSVVLKQDLTCPADGLIVGANDITIDLDGHTISGSDSGNGILAAGRPHVTIRNGLIRNFATSIRLINAPDSRIDTVTLPGSQGLAILSDTSNNLTLHRVVQEGRSIVRLSVGLTATESTFTNGQFDVSNVTQALFSVLKVTDARVAFNPESNGGTITRGTFLRSHIETSQADALSVTWSNFTEGGIQFGNFSRGATVTDNTFTGGETAIYAFPENSPSPYRIERNMFRNNNIGVRLRGLVLAHFGGVVVTDNDFINNSSTGMLLDIRDQSEAQLLTISDNRFVDNGKRSGGAVDTSGRPINDGLHINVPQGSNLEVRGNQTRDNAEYGIDAVPGTVIDGGGNTSTNNPSGCLGVVCN